MNESVLTYMVGCRVEKIILILIKINLLFHIFNGKMWQFSEMPDITKNVQNRDGPVWKAGHLP
jgi:hypothetical protein